LAASTQIEYDRYGNEIIADLGSVLLKDVTSAWVDALRDEWRLRGYRAASNLLQFLKNALSPAVRNKTIKTDPFANLERIKRPHDSPEANPAWEDAEVEAGIALALQRKQPGLARAIGLGRWGGFRRSTICAVPLNALTTGYDDDGEPHPRIYWVTEKRKVLANKRQDPRLTALLASTPNRAMTIAYNKDGHPWKKRALNQAITRLVEALAKEGKARSNLTIHGLRHARGVELAEAGASDAEIMCQLEHATERTAKTYREQANRRKMADSAQAKVDNVVQILARKKAAAK
jgi:integrase